MLKATNISRIFKRKHGTVDALSKVSVEIKEGELSDPAGAGRAHCFWRSGE
jgi:ABC-type lipoprotein export system ATPase subunit